MRIPDKIEGRTVPNKNSKPMKEARVQRAKTDYDSLLLLFDTKLHIATRAIIIRPYAIIGSFEHIDSTKTFIIGLNMK